MSDIKDQHAGQSAKEIIKAIKEMTNKLLDAYRIPENYVNPDKYVNKETNSIIKDALKVNKADKVWCRECGQSIKVNYETCFNEGWPKCCGYTMTIDDPEKVVR